MRKYREAWFALVVAVVVLLFGRVSLGDKLAEFEKGRNSYSAGRYDEAAERFRDMLDPNGEDPLTSPLLVEQARIYLSACLIAIGQLSEADAEIEAILRNNATVYPDTVVFPGQVLDRFADVRGRIRQELEDKARAQAELERKRLEQELQRRQRERERVAKLELLVQQEVHVVYNSRWIAAIPFGAGQFQNDQQAAAWTFLTAEAALAATSVVTGAIAQDLQSKGTARNVDTADVNRRVETMQIVNNAAFVAFAVVAVGGIMHAQLTFVPKRQEVRTRELPTELRATPIVSVVRDGALLGLHGCF